MKTFFTLLALLLLFAAPARAAADIAGLQAKAEKGDAVAQYNLGTRYFNGMDVKKDYDSAADWWRRAAKQGHASAQLELAGLYVEGHGVLQDYRKAYFWYSIAITSPATRTENLANAGRSAAASHLTPSEIADADKAVAAWKPKQE